MGSAECLLSLCLLIPLEENHHVCYLPNKANSSGNNNKLMSQSTPGFRLSVVLGLLSQPVLPTIQERGEEQAHGSSKVIEQ